MRVAIVSYFTPPQPAVASHRVLRMTRALLDDGHDVHWVTADAARINAPQCDPSLGVLTPAAVQVHGIDGQALITKPAAANAWEKLWRTVAWHVPRRFAYPDSFLSWARRLKRRLAGIVRAHGIDAAVLCCSPHNQILALPGLRRACPDLSIFVDYRDLLSGNPWNTRSSPALAQRIVALERRVLAHADALFVNTGAARERFAAVVGVIPGLDVEVMRNAADYDLADEMVQAAGAGDRGFDRGFDRGTDRGVDRGVDRGTDRDVDFAAGLGPGVHFGFFGALFPRRRLRPVFEAIATLAPGRRADLHLHVYCDAFDSAKLLIEDCAAVPAAAEHVHRHELLGYSQALGAMRAMEALVLVNGPDESDAVFVPGKLYDYLMARRPVLFLGHPGEASAIVSRTSGAQRVFAAADTAGLGAAFASHLASSAPDVAPVAEYGPREAFAPLLRRLVR